MPSIGPSKAGDRAAEGSMGGFRGTAGGMGGGGGGARRAGDTISKMGGDWARIGNFVGGVGQTSAFGLSRSQALANYGTPLGQASGLTAAMNLGAYGGPPVSAAPKQAPVQRKALPKIVAPSPVAPAPPVSVAPPVTPLPPTNPAPLTPGTFGVMAPTQVPGYKAPTAGLPAAVAPNISVHTPNQAAPSPLGAGVGGMPGGVPPAYRRDMTPAPGPTSTHVKSPGGDTGVGGVPGGMPAAYRRDTSPAMSAPKGFPGLPEGPSDYRGPGQTFGASGPSGAPSMGGYADAGQRYGAAARMTASPRNNDPGVAGVPGGLVGRGTTIGQAMAGELANSRFGQANPGIASAVMKQAVQGGFTALQAQALNTIAKMDVSDPKSFAKVMAVAKSLNRANLGLSPAALASLEKLDAALGYKLGIVSGYRSPLVNKKAGGAKYSQHMQGNAVDAMTAGMTPAQKIALIKAAKEAGFTGIGVYANNLHFDVAAPRAWGPDYTRGSIPGWARDAVRY